MMDGMDDNHGNTDPILTPDSEEVRKVVGTIVAALHPIRVLVFGSVARGTTGPNSDLDLLVIMPNGIHRRKAGQEADLALLRAKCRTPVDVVVATEQDILEHGNKDYFVLKHALQDGREVYRAA